MEQELRSMLGPQNYYECLMFRSPMVPLKRNHKTQSLFLSLFALVLVLNMFIILPPVDIYNGKV